MQTVKKYLNLSSNNFNVLKGNVIYTEKAKWLSLTKE